MPVSDQGVTRDRYMLIPRVLIFATRGNSVLLLKGAPTKRLWAGRYNGVGGHVEKGEDLLAAAHREMMEETGLESSLRLCGTLMVDSGEIPGIGVFIFTGEVPLGEVVASVEGSLEWVEWERTMNLPLVEDLPVLLPLVRAWKPGDPPFFARSFYDAEGKLIVKVSE